MSPRARRFAMLGAAWALSLVVTVQPFRDSDAWWHLAMGRYILAHGIPATEPFSFLHAAHPWVGQQWLYEVSLARLVDLGGASLASLVMGVAASTALLIAVLSIPASRRPSAGWQAAALLLSALVAAQLLGVRGQVVSLLFAAIVLNVVVRWRDGSERTLLLLPPLFALWANIHAGFVIGLAICALALAAGGAGGRRRLGMALGASLLATLANPATVHLWGYVAATFSSPTVTGVVTEWQSPDFHDVWLRLFELEAILLVVAWVLAARRSAFDVVLVGATFAASLQAQRNVSLFALVAAPQLAAHGPPAVAALRARVPRLSGWRPRRPPPPWFAAAVCAVVAVASVASVAARSTPASAASYESSHEPQRAADWVAAHLPGKRVYSIDTWGGYLAERFPHGRVVYLYDETAVFGDSALEQYLDIHDLRPDWTGAVARAGMTAAILPAQAQEVAALGAIGWIVDCRDGASGSVVMTAPEGASRASGQEGTPPSCG